MTVRIQIISDIHLEKYLNSYIDPLSIITPSAEILVLAGDISRLYVSTGLIKFLTELSKHFQVILYVLGNHEFYYDKGETKLEINQLIEKAQMLEKIVPKLHVLQKKSVRIGNLCIAGCTLWSEIKINFPRFIPIHGMTTQKYKEYFSSDLAYIHKMIKYCEKNGLKLVLITHHCPIGMNLNRNTNPYLDSLYTSSLEDLMDGTKISTWICGHVHYNFDYITKNGTRLVCNQYADGIDGFEKSKILKF